MNAVTVLGILVLLIGTGGLARALWPTAAERSFGYPHDSAEARHLRGER